MIVFMIGNSFLCTKDISGGECIKSLDNYVFAIQIGLNVAFSLFFFFKINQQNWWKLIVNILILTIFYIISAFLHSVLQIGLF